MHKLLTIFFLLCLTTLVIAQPDFWNDYKFTRADTIRGKLLPERSCFDVNYYVLDLEVDPANRSIYGSNEIHYTVIEDFTRMQLDLYANMEISAVQWKGPANNPSQAGRIMSLSVSREGDAFYIDFSEKQVKGDKGMVKVFYNGTPRIAKRPPWDGGFVWERDGNGQHHVGVACEGDGASLWWPNKDHLSDEPDSVTIRCTVPGGLMVVANGNLKKETKLRDNKTTFEWFVSYPINNYNVTLNIADYAHFKDVYTSIEDGSKLDLDYYVLKENLEKAKVHFQQVHPTLECFEKAFGKYPFWNDGFAMVETPYLGMEHQGAIAYGNQYKKGYLGRAPAGTTFDYIIIHETAHEYFGNSISCHDLAEMWIHESFGTYMETMYVEYTMGYEASLRYIATQKFGIRNQEPIIGPKDVNWADWSGGDHYHKGAWVLHTLRHAINDDEQWFKMLRSFHESNKLTNMQTEEIVWYFSEFLEQDLIPFFDQYLRYTDIPTVEYSIKEKGKDLIVKYRLLSDTDMSMNIRMGEKGNYKPVEMTPEWQSITLKKIGEEDFRIATELFLLKTKVSKG
ncbi:MAG: M1 family metallopeptidase [Bacteroidota bacterium]